MNCGPLKAEEATASSPAKWECRSPHFEDQQPHSNVYGIPRGPGSQGRESA
ncbi:hypothetical protein LEMLEM_LOCUS2195 [Lemmus lemmus]